MRRAPGSSLLLLVLGLICGAGSAQDAVEPPPEPSEATAALPAVMSFEAAEVLRSAEDAELEAYVDGVIAAWRTVHGAPGYTVSVVRPDRTVFAKGYGLADIEAGTAVDPERTRFYVASISKTFVWTAVMMLVDRGVVSLDADVNDYLERYRVPAGERPLTLDDLMAHRGGVEENLTLFTPEAADMALPEAMAFTEPAQVFPRGERAAYSNWGSNLVALVIEDATGRSYGDFLLEEILLPLGMRATALDEDSPAAQDSNLPISKNYRVGGKGPEEVPQLDLGAFAPIGGMTTTAGDMGRWMRFHLNRGELDGVRLISEGTYAELRRRSFDPVPEAPGRTKGFSDLPYRTTLYFGHTGSINAFYSKFAVAPELGLGVFISQNTSDSFAPLNGLPRLVFDRELALDGVDLDRRPQPTDADIAAAEALAGKYITSRRVFHGFEKMLALLDGTFDVAASEGRITTGRPNSPYVQIAPDVWENRLGERLAVVRHADGTVARLITSSGGVDFEPVTLLTNPLVLVGAVGATVLFGLTTWLGLWRRWGNTRDKRLTGQFLSLLALLATAPLIWMGTIAARMGDVQNMGFAEIFVDWPLPLMREMALAATLATATAVLLAVCLVPAWRSSGWSIWRKLHYSLFAVAYLAMGVSFVNWGMAPHLSI